MQKHNSGKPVSYDKFFHLQSRYSIAWYSEIKYAEIIQRNYNAIFTGVRKVSLKKEK